MASKNKPLSRRILKNKCGEEVIRGNTLIYFSTAFLLTKNGSLFSLDLAKRTEENLALRFECLQSQTVTSMMSEFTWNRATSPLIYALTWNGMIAINPSASSSSPSSNDRHSTSAAGCSDIHVDWSKFGEKGLKAISSFTMAD